MEDKKLTKLTRHRYFRLCIRLGVKLNKMHPRQYISQSMLEKALYILRTKDRGRVVCLEDFHGQLEKDSEGVIFWNVVLETNVVTTARGVFKIISEELFEKNDERDSRICVYSLGKFEHPEREKLISIDESRFFPGFFNKTFLKFKELWEKEEVQERLGVRAKQRYEADDFIEV